MNHIRNKIDFAQIISVNNANPNGDPLNGNRPRTTIDGHGEISDVCIKRKLRNRLQDMGENIFVQSADRADDGMESLRDRAEPLIRESKKNGSFTERACERWFDVRAFGQLFAFGSDGPHGVSIGIKGPVSVHPAISVAPINIVNTQITKSVNSETKDKKGSDTMGMKYRVHHGLYILKGSINPQLASKTGFDDDDADTLKKALSTLLINDSSSSRPDGSMEIIQTIWWRHDSALGRFSTAKVHNSLRVTTFCDTPARLSDYEIQVEDLPGIETEVISEYY